MRRCPQTHGSEWQDSTRAFARFLWPVATQVRIGRAPRRTPLTGRAGRYNGHQAGELRGQRPRSQVRTSFDLLCSHPANTGLVSAIACTQPTGAPQSVRREGCLRPVRDPGALIAVVSLARFWRQCDRAVLAQPLVTAVPGGESAPLTRAALGIDDSACVPFARPVLLHPSVARRAVSCCATLSRRSKSPCSRAECSPRCARAGGLACLAQAARCVDTVRVRPDVRPVVLNPGPVARHGASDLRH